MPVHRYDDDIYEDVTRDLQTNIVRLIISLIFSFWEYLMGGFIPTNSLYIQSSGEEI